VVRLAVVALGREPIAVKHLHLAVVPAGTDRLDSLPCPDLHVCHVVALLLRYVTEMSQYQIVKNYYKFQISDRRYKFQYQTDDINFNIRQTI